MKRVLIVDDHPLMRKALRALVSAQPDLEVCGEADNEPEAIDRFRRCRPCMAIVDLSLRSGSGLDLIKRIHCVDEHARILVVSVHDDALYAPRAIEAGALGYVNKAEPEERILEAIRKVLEGKIALSASTSEHLIRRWVGKRRAPDTMVEKLSDRELEVLELIGQGFSTRRIAEHLRLSVKTIETHREKLKLKLDLPDGSALARYAAVWEHEQSESSPHEGDATDPE